MKETSLPFQIRIASPCSARWEDMGGDDRVRFCDQCRKNVYNLSAMTAAEATALLEEKRGKLCARIYQRTDGTILTEDCPVGIARQWRRVKAFAGAALGTVLFMLISATALGRDSKSGSANNDLRQRIEMKLDDAKWTVKGWFGIKRPAPMLGRALMGDVAVTVPVPPPPTQVPPKK